LPPGAGELVDGGEEEEEEGERERFRFLGF